MNWCPFHLTSLSDLELAHEDVDDALSYARYPLADGGGHITVATARPATIPADVAVAVHPDDGRYRDLIGREVVVPWAERRVPVIADELLGVGPEGLGILMSGAALGSMAGTALLAALVERSRQGPLLLAAFTGFGLLLMLLSVV